MHYLLERFFGAAGRSGAARRSLEARLTLFKEPNKMILILIDLINMVYVAILFCSALDRFPSVGSIETRNMSF